MSIILYDKYHPLRPLQKHEIRYLREALGWSQVKMGRFLSKDTGTISRWESGQFEPDPLTLGVLHNLWIKVFGKYEGPYPDWYAKERKSSAAAKPEQTESAEMITLIGKALLIGGVAYFIAKGLNIKEENGNNET